MPGLGRILVVNAGSSSLKLSVVEDGQSVAEGSDDLAGFVAEAGTVDAVGHRVVHGGAELVDAVRIDDEVERRIDALTPLAPLHQTAALDGIRTARARLRDVPQYACFDTAFHATLPAAAATYALPTEWNARFGLRRFGFHGLSHAYASRRAAELLGRSPQGLRIVTCHLGAGSSLCAVRDGVSVDTTMGFTPLDGLVMATRSGSVDPGLLVYLLQQGIAVDELGDALEARSGLAGLAGTGDMREVLERAGTGDPDATLALDVWRHRLVREIAAMVASLGGLDALVFTGGIGERAADLRVDVVARLTFLPTPPEVLVIEAREDLEIARQIQTVFVQNDGL
jgi:acetate kinase